MARLAIFDASSPMRSRSITDLEMLMIRRRSEAAGWRRARNAQAFLVDVGFHLVDLVIDLAHLLGQAGVGLDQRGDGVVDLLLDQTAHRQEVAAHFLQLGVELLRDVMGEAVFVDHLEVLGSASVSPLQREEGAGRVRMRKPGLA